MTGPGTITAMADEDTNKGGRPPIGPVQLIRFTDAVSATVEALAATEGVSKAEMYRRLVDEALTARTQAAGTALGTVPAPAKRRRTPKTP